MIQETQRRLIPRLLDEAITWHTRRGFRKDCLCAYCSAKGTAFYTIATAGRKYVRNRVVQAYTNPKARDREDIGYEIWLHRKALRKQWKEILKDIKENS